MRYSVAYAGGPPDRRKKMTGGLALADTASSPARVVGASATMLPRLTLVVAFRETGWRRPLRDPVALEVWAPDARLVAILPASYLEELLRAHLSLTEVQQRLGTFLAPPEAPSPPPRAPMPSKSPQPKLRGAQGRRLRRPHDSG